MDKGAIASMETSTWIWLILRIMAENGVMSVEDMKQYMPKRHHAFEKFKETVSDCASQEKAERALSELFVDILGTTYMEAMSEVIDTVEAE